MNLNKTKILTKNEKEKIRIENQEMKNINEIQYLGQISSINNNKEIEKRIKVFWKKC